MIDLCAIRRLQTALRTFEEELKAKTGLSFNDALLLCAVNVELRALPRRRALPVTSDTGVG